MSFFRTTEWQHQRRLSYGDMAQQALFIFSRRTNLWNLVFIEGGNKKGKLSNAAIKLQWERHACEHNFCASNELATIAVLTLSLSLSHFRKVMTTLSTLQFTNQ